ncbi:MAG TPA: hypothetical protein VJS17_04350 [Pyrinomonadaceae bacterium]|nr:hypothetical protein [Pyrinomonadaceae bacterium]
MTNPVKLDEIRAAALARVDRSERNFKLAFFGAAIVEMAFIVTFLLLADLSNRLHVLLLISTVSCYSIVVLGLVALGAHINRGVARLLKAIELFKD